MDRQQFDFFTDVAPTSGTVLKSRISLDPYSPEGLQKTLSARMMQFAVCYATVAKEIKILNTLVEKNSYVLDKAIATEEALQKCLSEILLALSKSNRGIGNARIELNDLDSKFFAIRKIQPEFRYELPEDKAGFIAAIEKFINGYDYIGLSQSLVCLGDLLEKKGINISADKTAVFLNMKVLGNLSYCVPVPQKNRIIFSRFLHTSDGDYSTNDVNFFIGMIKHFSTIEKETGISGLSCGMKIIADAFRTQTFGRIPSRTKLNAGNTIECVVYKEKIKISILDEVADTIFAFLAMHATVELRDISSA